MKKRKHSLRTQILASLLILTLFATLTVTMTSWHICKNKIEENYRTAYQANLQTFNGILNDKLQAMNDLVRSVFLSTDFLKILEAPNDREGPYYRSSEELALSRLCRQLEGQSDLVKGVAVFDEKGRYYFWNKTNTSLGDYLDYYKEKDCTSEDWYQIADASEGKEVYFGGNVLSSFQDPNTVSLVKEIKDLQTWEKQGMLVLLLTKSFLSTTLVGSGTDFNSDTLMIVDHKSDDSLVYHTNTQEYSDKMYAAYLSQAGPEPFLFTECTNSVTGWKIVNGIDTTELSRESVYLRTMVFAVGFLILIACILISNLVSHQIYKPLGKLERVLAEVREGSRNITEEFDDSEIGEIGNTLKETVNHNIELKERLLSLRLKERESELLLLQAQINPHFLYNTLDSIYCKAEIENQMEIATMVGALSDIFKISLSSGKSEIRIREEIDYIQKYMQIQDLRYENRFELILEIEEDILDLHIIKLILQPFVENAMYHGLEAKIGKGFIEIKGERIGNDIYFTITDDGIGMKNPSAIYSGFGVKNVVDRIHLFYGEEYGIQVTSEYNVGTKIEIRIPVMEREVADHAESGGD
ncbi:MAG: histidine kinase [Candidatus Limivivens sp.]|nr:histidine kinase [Candidatus Limivivens sp.]